MTARMDPPHGPHGGPSLFHGLSFHIEPGPGGFKLTDADLMKVIRENGGRTSLRPDPPYCTHIIITSGMSSFRTVPHPSRLSSLTPADIERRYEMTHEELCRVGELVMRFGGSSDAPPGSERRAKKVVRQEWVYASVRTGRRVPEAQWDLSIEKLGQAYEARPITETPTGPRIVGMLPKVAGSPISDVHGPRHDMTAAMSRAAALCGRSPARDPRLAQPPRSPVSEPATQSPFTADHPPASHHRSTEHSIADGLVDLPSVCHRLEYHTHSAIAIDRKTVRPEEVKPMDPPVEPVSIETQIPPREPVGNHTLDHHHQIPRSADILIVEVDPIADEDPISESSVSPVAVPRSLQVNHGVTPASNQNSTRPPSLRLAPVVSPIASSSRQSSASYRGPVPARAPPPPGGGIFASQFGLPMSFHLLCAEHQNIKLGMLITALGHGELETLDTATYIILPQPPGPVSLPLDAACRMAREQVRGRSSRMAVSASWIEECTNQGECLDPRLYAVELPEQDEDPKDPVVEEADPGMDDGHHSVIVISSDEEMESDVGDGASDNDSNPDRRHDLHPGSLRSTAHEARSFTHDFAQGRKKKRRVVSSSGSEDKGGSDRSDRCETHRTNPASSSKTGPQGQTEFSQLAATVAIPEYHGRRQKLEVTAKDRKQYEILKDRLAQWLADPSPSKPGRQELLHLLDNEVRKKVKGQRVFAYLQLKMKPAFVGFFRAYHWLLQQELPEYKAWAKATTRRRSSGAIDKGRWRPP